MILKAKVWAERLLWSSSKDKEYHQFVRILNLSVNNTLELMVATLSASDLRPALKPEDELWPKRLQTYDEWMVFLFRVLGRAFDEQFERNPDKIAELCRRQDLVAKVQKVIDQTKEIERVQKSCGAELKLLKEIVENSREGN
jgi:hypothetical protein